MKHRIHQNQWGNWNAYTGSRFIKEFGTDERGAREWLRDQYAPPADTEALPMFQEWGASVEVFVRIKDRPGIYTGRYMRALGEWQINGVHSSQRGGIPVVEWFNIPPAGTGNPMPQS